MRKLTIQLSAQLLALFLLGWCGNQTQAQLIKPCGADEMRVAAMANDPTIALKSQAFESYFQEYLNAQIKAGNASKTTENSWGLRTVYTIPCVVHVVHDGDPATKDDSISLEQVQSQFDVLFENYRKVPFTMGYGSGVDMQIEFALATIDPNGKPTAGVTYEVSKDLVDVSKENEDGKLKSLGTWNRKKYLNIWTVSSIGGKTSGGDILGYAQFPDMPDGTDGIVVRSYVFGTIGTVGQNADTKRYTKGRTTTHEMGHWLNLFHPFTDGCSESSCQGGGDKLCDTPPTKDENFGFGEDRQNTCTKDRPDMPDNPHNYMDYLNDLGLNYFSPQQKLRGTSALRNPNFSQRNALWKDDNLKATGTGPYGTIKADFVSPNITSCVGEPVKFMDYSPGSPNKFEWQFTGGTPATSTDVQPTVTYSKAGKYKVTLKVTNAGGKTASIEKENYITITDKVMNVPFNYNFSDATLPDGWAIRDYDASNPRLSKGWELITDGKYMRMRCAQYSDYKQVDDLILPALNLASVSKPTINFRYSYTPTRTVGAGALLYTDTLEISASEDCGANWTLIYKKGGHNLASTATKDVESEISDPLNNQWSTDFGCLKNFANKPKVQIRFRVINGFGNNVFLDDISVDNSPNITCWPVGMDKQTTIIANTADIAPNPTNEQIDIHLALATPNTVSVQVMDATGKNCFSMPSQIYPSGVHQVRLPINLAVGIYQVVIQMNDQTITQKVVKN